MADDNIKRIDALTGDSHTILGIGQNKNRFEEDPEYLKASDDVARILNTGEVTTSAKKIWANMEGYAHDKFTSGQGTYEALLGIGKNTKIGVWDIETIGSPEFMRANDVRRGKNGIADFFSVTEIAMKTVRGPDMKETGEQLSLLISPNQKSMERIQSAINMLHDKGWTGLSDDMRRSLADISQYGAGAKIRKENGFTYLESHGTKFKDVALGTKEGISQIERGFNNLKQATPIEKALFAVNKLVDSKTVLAGHNVHNFDQRAMLDVLSATKERFKHSPNQYKALDRLHQNMQRSQLDTLEFFRTFYETPLQDFGGNMTLGNLYRKLTGRSSEQAHFALADINMNISLLGKALRDGKETKSIQSLKRLSANTVEMGQVYYSNRGLGSDGKYDAIYDKDKQGKFIRARDFRTATLNKNNHYEVVSEVQKMMIEGKEQYGITLLNHDTGYHHQIVRERFDDIANIFQKNLVQLTDDPKTRQSQLERMKTNEKDRARREYEKLFDVREGKGIDRLKKNYAFLDAYDRHAAELAKTGMDAPKLHESALGRALDAVNDGADAKYHVGTGYGENVLGMRGRLDSEKDIWNEAIKRIEKEDFHYTVRPAEGKPGGRFRDKVKETYALSKIKDQLEALGTGEKEKYMTPGVKTMEMTLNGKTRNLNVSDRTSFISSVKSILSRNVPMSQQKQMFLEMVQQLEQTGVINADMRKEYLKIGMDRFNAHKHLEVNDVEKIAREVQTAAARGGVGTKSSNGTNAKVQAMTAPIREYVEGTAISKSPIGSVGHQLMTTGVNGQHGKLFFEQIVQSSIEQSRGYSKYNVVDNVFLNVPKTVKEKIEQHNQGARLALEKSGLINLPRQQISSIVGQSRDIKAGQSFESKVINLANSYAQNFGVRVDYNNDTGKMMMMLSKKEHASAMMGMALPDAIKSNQVAHFEIPMMNPDGTIEVGGRQFVGRLSAGIGRNNTFQVTNVVDEFFNEMGSHSNRLNNAMKRSEEIGGEMNILDVHGRINSKIQRIQQGLVTNHALFTANPEKEFARNSRLANHNRAMQIDVTGMAEHWYNARGSKFQLSNQDRIKERMGKENLSFFQAMGLDEQNYFHRDIEGFMNENFMNGKGQLSHHGLSDAQARNGIRSLVDNRQYFAFGEFNPTARENLNKALNYRALASDANEMEMVRSRVASTNSESQTYRMMKGLTTTDAAKGIQGEEFSHLNVRVGLSNELQVNTLVKSAQRELDGKIDELRRKTNLSPDEAKELAKLEDMATRLKRVSSMSMHDGMVLASSSIQEALGTMKQKSVDVGIQGRLNPKLQKLMEDKGLFTTEGALKVESGQGISFEELKKAGMVQEKNGNYRITVGSIMTADKGEFKAIETGEYKNWHKNFEITGFDADSGRVLINEYDKANQSFKAITLGGGRHTMQFIDSDLMAHITKSDDIKVLMPEPEVKKNMGGTYLRSVVDTYSDEIRKQLLADPTTRSEAINQSLVRHGHDGGRLTVADLSKNGLEDKVMGDLLRPALDDELKMKGQYTIQDGAVIMNGNIVNKNGYDAQNLSKERVLAFDERMGRETGFNRRSAAGFEIVNDGIGKHDIYSYESTGQKMRIGKKEMNVIKSIYGEHVNGEVRDVVAGGADYSKWLQNELHSSSTSREPAKEIFGEIISGMQGNNMPKAGDTVIDFSGKTVADDVNTVYEVGGVNYADSKILDKTGKITAKDMAFIAEDHAGTIMSHKLSTVKINGEDKQLGSITSGNSYMKLPEEFGENRFVQLVDTSKLSRLDESAPMMLEIQKKQLGLYRNLKEFENLGKGTLQGEELAKHKQQIMQNVEASVTALQEETTTFATSARDGGLINKLMVGKADMSAQFRVQTVNPFENFTMENGEWKNTGPYKESTVYMSRNRMSEMIEGNEKNIAQAIYGKEAQAMIEQHGDNLHSVILDDLTHNVEGKNMSLYGNANRYPTINDSTMQATRFVVDGNMAHDDRRALISVGTLKVMAGDTDGDVINGMLTHYKDKDAAKWHEVVKNRHDLSLSGNEQQAATIINEYREDLAKTYMTTHNYSEGAEAIDFKTAQKRVDDIIVGNQQGKDVTVQTLVAQGFDEEKASDFFKYKVNIDENILTTEARQGKGSIGMIDNVRESMRELHSMTQEALVNHGLIDEQAARRNEFIVQNFGSTISQELISSKKVNIETLVNEVQAESPSMAKAEVYAEARERMQRRHENVENIYRLLQNPTTENQEKLYAELSNLGMFDGGNKYFNGQAISKQDILREGIDQLGQAHELTAARGGMQSPALAINRSSGMKSEERLASALVGETFMPTSSHHEILTEGMKDGEQYFESRKKDFQAHIANTFKERGQHSNLIDSIQGDLGGGPRYNIVDEISKNGGSFLSETAGDAMGKVKTGTSEVFNGIKKMASSPMAVSFAAIWGASAMMRSAPTPEGAEAQQEARQVDVAPEQMLTSPTARVTPKGESTILKISGRGMGGMDHNALAGIVNSEVQQMSGTKMDMNVNINDNTQTISNRWIQQKLNESMNQ